VHFAVGRQVRNTIRANGNIMPEDLAAEPHIKTIRDKFRVRRSIADEQQGIELLDAESKTSSATASDQI